MRLAFSIIISLVFLTSCKEKNKEYKPLSSGKIQHQIKVKEVLQTGTYTYLFVNENEEDYWMAISKTDIKIDDHLFYEDAVVMKDFKSDELDRTFDKILFVGEIGGVKLQEANVPNDSIHNPLTKEDKKPEISVGRAPDGITIAELFEQAADYANKKVIIRGQVVKINSGIMDRNWVHLQDGTGESGKTDLTFTTQEEVTIGDIVTLEGTVAIDKEYGAGYVYPLIVENAVKK